MLSFKMNASVVDPGFPGGGGGANPRVWGKNLLFGKIFAKNCMKMKEIVLGGGARPYCPSLDQPMRVLIQKQNILSNIKEDKIVRSEINNNNTKLCYF